MASVTQAASSGWLGRALRHRNYRLFFCGQSVSLIGTWLTRVATSWLVFRLSHSAWVLGLVTFAGLIPACVFTPFAGVLADRWNKHRVLTITQVCAAIQSAALAVLTLSHWINIPLVLLLSAFQGFINAFDIPVRQSFVVQMIEDKQDLPNAIALNSSMVNLARLIGPSFAGLLIAALGEGGCFTIDAISYAAVIATLLLMRIPPRPEALRERKPLLRELGEGLSYARGSQAIVALLALLCLVSFTGVPYMTLLPMVVSERLAGGARDLGYLTAASRQSLGGIGRLIALAAFGFGASLIGFGFSQGIWLSLVLMLSSGMGMMVQMAASNTVLQTIVDEDKRGRIMSLYAMAFTGMSPFGGLLGGWLADRLGAGMTLAWGGLACCLASLVFLRALPAIQRQLAAVKAC